MCISGFPVLTLRISNFCEQLQNNQTSVYIQTWTPVPYCTTHHRHLLHQSHDKGRYFPNKGSFSTLITAAAVLRQSSEQPKGTQNNPAITYNTTDGRTFLTSTERATALFKHNFNTNAKYVYCWIEARSRNDCCHRRAICITNSECVSVALVIHRAERMRRIILSCSTVQYFSRLSNKRHDFRGGGKRLNIKCVFWFSLQLLSETFLLRITHVHSFSCKLLVSF